MKMLLGQLPIVMFLGFVLYVTDFDIDCGGTDCLTFAAYIHNGGAEPAVCGVGAVTPTSYDFALCPGETRHNHHWKGILTCVQAPEMKDCAGYSPLVG